MKISPTEQVMASDEEQPKMSACLLKAISPVVKSMEVLGHYSGNRRTASLAFGWSCVVLLVLAQNCVRIFWIYADSSTFGAELALVIVFHMWFIQAFLSGVAMIWTSRRVGRFVDAINHLYEARQKSFGHCSRLKFQVTVAVSFAWITLAGSTGIIAAAFFSSSSHLDFLVTPFLGANKEAEQWALIAYLPVHVLTAGAWLFPPILYSTIASVLRQEFLDFSESLGNADLEHSALESYRLHHLEICALTRTADRLLCALGCNIFVTNVPMICFFIYSMWYAEFVLAIDWAAVTYWLVINVLIIYSTTSAAAALAYSVKRPIVHVYQTDLMKLQLNEHKSMQISMFLSQLHESVGFTLIGIFTIEKKAILIITAAILTYTALLIKIQTYMNFQPTAGPPRQS